MSAPRGKPVFDPVKPIIDAWLEEDRARPRKQRLTAQRMYERLRDEHGFAGNPTTVRRYVREARRRTKEVYMPPAFEPVEEAQVDWHDGWIEENGVQREARFFCMRMCYSTVPFVRPYERANMESFPGRVRRMRPPGNRRAWLLSAAIALAHQTTHTAQNRSRFG